MTDEQLQSLRSDEERLRAASRRTRATHNEAIDAWHRVWVAIEEEMQRRVIRSELRAEMEAEKVTT